MRALIPLALAALLSACLPFGGRDEAVPRKDNPLAAETIGVTSLDAPAAPAATSAPAPSATPPGRATQPQSQPAAPTARAAEGASPQQTTPQQPTPQARPSRDASAPGAAGQPAAAATDAAPTEEPPPPPPKSPMQIACEKDGGTWSRAGGSVAMTCFKPTRDGGKSCRRESDCSTLCLARSRTCAPVTPLFGCHSVLQNDGRAVTLCLD